MTQRYIRLRDFEAACITSQRHHRQRHQSQSGFAFALLDIGVAYREDVDEV